MTDLFNISFFIDASFKYVQPSGDIVMCYAELMEDVRLLDTVVCVNNLKVPCPFLSSHHPHFFKMSSYVKIELD